MEYDFVQFLKRQALVNNRSDFENNIQKEIGRINTISDPEHSIQREVYLMKLDNALSTSKHGAIKIVGDSDNERIRRLLDRLK